MTRQSCAPSTRWPSMPTSCRWPTLLPDRRPCAVRCSASPAIRSATASRRRWSTSRTPSSSWPTAGSPQFGPADRIARDAAARHRDPRFRQGRADLGGLRRQPRPLPADADDRGLRLAAPRLAEQVHLSDRAQIRRQGIRPRRRPRLPAGKPAQRHHHELRLLHRPSAVGRRAVRGGGEARPAAGRRQGDDGSQRTRRTARHGAIGLRRVAGPDRQVARPRPAALCHHAALRRHQFAGATRRWPAGCGGSIPSA